MRITSVELHPAGSSDVCVLSFRDPSRQNPFNVKAIVGLDADEIVPRYYGISEDSNTKYYNLSLEKRDLVVRIELNPSFSLNESYSDLRDRLYKMIASSRTGVIQIQFKNGESVTAAISGFVSKFEASHFEKNPEVQLTVQCSDPMLRALEPIIVDIGALDPALTNIQDLLSTAPHGFMFEMNVLGALASFSIGDVAADWSFEITPAGGFLANDLLHFSSEHNKKELYLVRGGNTIHLADVIAPGSFWPVLFPGDNEFVCQDDTLLTWETISYYPTYWGV